jgi:EAL domain-containing protein (putative c-di-GMP-specific phosphodiesterase class I)
LAVNLSARQLADPEVVDTIREGLIRYDLNAGRITLEITESVLMFDSPATRRLLAALQDLGVELALDDFGTGYSSLAYLHALPVKALKIDRSFVERLGGDEDSTDVVKAVVDMSRALGLQIVAEGVDTARQATIVSNLGCDRAQGFYWARPMPAARFAAWWQHAEGNIASPLPAA